MHIVQQPQAPVSHLPRPTVCNLRICPRICFLESTSSTSGNASPALGFGLLNCCSGGVAGFALGVESRTAASLTFSSFSCASSASKSSKSLSSLASVSSALLSSRFFVLNTPPQSVSRSVSARFSSVNICTTTLTPGLTSLNPTNSVTSSPGMCVSSGCASTLDRVQQIQPVRMPSSMFPSGMAPPTLASMRMRFALRRSLIFSSLRPRRPAALAFSPCSRRSHRAKRSAATCRWRSERAVASNMMSLGPSAGGGSSSRRSSRCRSSRPAVTARYSSSAGRMGGGFVGRSGMWAAWTGARGADCCFRYQGTAGVVVGVGVASPRDSVMVEEAASGAMASSVVAVGCSTSISASTGSFASRKANSGSVCAGSSLSFLRGVLVLKAFLEALLAGPKKRFAKPLGPVEGVTKFLVACLQALHTNRDGADMLTVAGRN
ncbi:hypothetical protein B5807_09332 [Epicoccum nigrum]|uniref:Uncharacterized protein n=1 Tax=Epicoccum nigrum TaxID=105696 RepID=A0A1Y2LMD0_EPING|nr:hypothetical protein B5807_09332 [Epicoccum nigrum]